METTNAMNTDQMSTAELIDAAKVEWDRWTEPSPATCALHVRGTREVLDAAATMCKSAEPKSRSVGADILGQLGQPERTFPDECCDVLLQLLNQEDDDQVKAAVVFALGHLRNDRAIPSLIALSRHPNSDVRHAVASSLYGVTSDAAVAAQLDLMDDSNPEARDWAVTAIGENLAIDGPQIREAFLRHASDEDVFTRAEALHGLARRGDTRVVIYLLAELPVERECAHLFIDIAKTYLGYADDAEPSLDELLRELRSRAVPSS